MPMHYRTYCVVNPNSANGSTAKAWPEIRRTIEEAIGEVGWSMTDRPGEATALTRQAILDGWEQIVAVGGDGTLNEVINGFFQEGGEPLGGDPVVAFVSRGTGGDFRKIFGLDRRSRGYAEILKGRGSSPVDVGRIVMVDHEGREVVRHFINIASFGIGGLVDKLVNESTKALGGKASFLLGSLRAILQYRNQAIRLSVDGGPPREISVNNVAVANGQFFGGGMWIAPEARIDDGLFDVVILGDLSLQELLLQGPRIYQGTHIQLPKVEHFQARSLHAESDEVVLLDVDGEQPGRLPATFSLLPGALRLKGVQVR